MNLEKWTGIPGGATNFLQQDAIRLRTADVSSLNNGASFSNLGDNYGARLRGYITAPVTGEYTFFVAGDDFSELSLSTDDKAFNKQKIAWFHGYTAFNQWDKSATQRSKSVALVAGQKYYIEAQVKEGGGGDHLSIGWAYQDTATAVNWGESAIGGNVTQTWTDQAGVVSLDVEAGDIWGGADHFGFRHRQWTGDGEFIAKISNMNNPHAWAKVGLMLRSTLDANSSFALMARTGSNNMAFQRRATTGGGCSHTGFGTTNDWVKLVRKGDMISAYVSENGVVWSHVGNQIIANLPTTVYIGVAATDHASSNHVTATVSNFKTGFINATEQIPAAHLSSLAPNANDADDNLLPDDWEATHGIQAPTADLSSGKYGEYGDFDNDGISNLLEYQLGMNPAQRNVIVGALCRETWYGIGGGAIKNLTSSNKFKSEPDLSEYGTTINAHNRQDNYGARYKGLIVAPTTGYYSFWISGDDEAELWLADGTIQPVGVSSPHKNVYGKHKIASIQDSRFERNYTADEDFDRFPSQKSKSIYLEADQSYYLEVLHKEGGGQDHVAVAWQVPGASREIIPSSVFTTAMPELDDVDQDNLPDAWEISKGLDIANNGLGNSKEGEFGDYDSDGLTNLQEYQNGTNPLIADTDGDGVDDLVEIDGYGSNPLVNDIQPFTLADSINVATQLSSTGVWNHTGSGSIYAVDRRGAIDYGFSVAEAGLYEIRFTGRAKGDNLRAIEKLKLVMTIDGVLVGKTTLASSNGAPQTVKLMTNWLKTGSHTLKVFHDNADATRSLQIDRIEVYKVGGFDGGGDNIADWAQAKIEKGNAITVCPSNSKVSPVCVEGYSRYFNTLNLKLGSENIEVYEAIDNFWYSNIDLKENESVSLTASFEGGAKTIEKEISWERTNLLQSPNLILRVGDKLKLGAWVENSTGVATLKKDGVLLGETNSYIIHSFDLAGSYSLSATYIDTDGTEVVSTVNITVEDVQFGSAVPTYVYRTRNWSIPGLKTSTAISSDTDIVLAEQAATNGARTFEVTTFEQGRYYTIARLAGSGVIQARGVVEGHNVNSTSETRDTQVIHTYDNGDKLIQMSIVADTLPPNGYIKLKIFVAGVTFADGTTEMILRAEDFNANGISYVRFNYPSGQSTSVCHRLYLYDANDQLVGTR